MSLNVKDLSAEERAIVDGIAMMNCRTPMLLSWDQILPIALEQAEPIILARRAIFAPAQPEPKREPAATVDKGRGIYNKFIVERADGKSEPGEKHYGCEYFVLDLTHDKFAQPALRAYAEACSGEFPQLADDLFKKCGKPETKREEMVLCRGCGQYHHGVRCEDPARCDEPEPEREEKFRPCGCVVCTCEDEIQCHGCGAKMCELHRQQREPTPSTAPAPKREECQADLTGKTLAKFPVGNCIVCGELVAPYNAHAKHEGGYTCQPAPSPAPVAWHGPKSIGALTGSTTVPVAGESVRFEDWPQHQERAIREIERRPQPGNPRIGSDKTAPVDGKEAVGDGLALAVRTAVDVLKGFASDFLKRDAFYSASDAYKASNTANTLEFEFWARSQAQPRDYDALHAVMSALFYRRISPGKGEKLIEQWADRQPLDKFMHATAEDEEELENPAASAQPQPTARDLPKVREFLLWAKRMQFTADGEILYMDALAELDASTQPGREFKKVKEALSQMLQLIDDRQDYAPSTRKEMRDLVDAAATEIYDAQPKAVPVEAPAKGCNRHVDCDEAYRKNPNAKCCHDDCCEDCFGS